MFLAATPNSCPYLTTPTRTTTNASRIMICWRTASSPMVYQWTPNYGTSTTVSLDGLAPKIRPTFFPINASASSLTSFGPKPNAKPCARSTTKRRRTRRSELVFPLLSPRPRTSPTRSSTMTTPPLVPDLPPWSKIVGSFRTSGGRM